MSNDNENGVIEFIAVDSRGKEATDNLFEEEVAEEVIELVSFGVALQALLEEDALVARMGWGEDDEFVQFEEGTETRQPYFIICTGGLYSPWVPTNIDLIVADWYIL